MITFLIPTINRSDLIIKYLYYLKKNKFNGKFYLEIQATRNIFKQQKNIFEN